MTLTRRVLLTLAPPALTAVLPGVLLAAGGDRLSWDEWVRGYIWCLIAGGVLVWLCFRTRRWPALQRLLVALSWACSAPLVVYATVEVSSVVAVPNRWVTIVLAVLSGPVAGALGWVAAGRGPAGPPPLRPGERPVFISTTRSRQLTMSGCVMLTSTISLSAASRMPGALLFAGLALFYLLLAVARIRIDRRGVVLTLPLLGGVSRLVPFHHIAYAEAAPRPAGSVNPVVEVAHVSGYWNRTEIALVLHLIGGQEFVVTVDHAQYAATLVNHELARQRSATPR